VLNEEPEHEGCVTHTNDGLVGRQSGSISTERSIKRLAHVVRLPWKLLIRRRSHSRNGLINMGENTKRHWRIGRWISVESHSLSDALNLVKLLNSCCI